MKLYSYTNNKMKIILISVLFIICNSCYQDVIDLDLWESEKQIVIEGIISDGTAPCRVLISETADLYKSNPVLPISDATVTIYDDEDNFAVLYESKPGVYESNLLRGVPGRTYRLQVIYKGKEYSAVSKMPVPIVLDSIKYYPAHGSTSSSYKLYCYFKDHKGTEDYCRLKLYRNGLFLDEEKILYHGNYTDGELVEIDDINETFRLNDLVAVEVYSINRNIYDFYSVLFSIEEEDMEDPSVIELVSANPKSNISNNALGYFSAHTIRYYTLFIK